MKRWSYWIIGLLLVGLVVGIAVPTAMASRTSNPGGGALPVTPDEAELAEFAADLQEAYAAVDNDEATSRQIKLLDVTLGGGFRGEWGTDNTEDADPMGSLVGIYGKAKIADKEIGYFKGIWLADDDTLFGYLRGVCSDNGTFTGIWRNPETGAGGLVEGTYEPVGENTTGGSFEGEWRTRDGEQTGYLNGTWSPVASLQRQGRFGGRWINDNQISALCRGARVPAECKARLNGKCIRAGRLWGSYGEIKLADGTSIHYFRGKWHAANNSAHGRLGGLAIDGKFYGVWGGHKKGYYAGGYLTGDYSYDSQLEKEPKGTFEGAWGRFGQEGNGQLKGKFGPLGVSEPFENQEF